MDKTQLVKRIQDLSAQLRQAKAELDKFNADATDEYQKKKFSEFKYPAKSYDTIKETEFPIYTKGTDSAGFGINKWGLVEHGVSYYGGGAAQSVATSVEEAKKRIFFDRVAEFILEVNRAAAQNRQKDQNAPYVQLELDAMVKNLYKTFVEAQLNGAFENMDLSEILDDKKS